MWEDNKGRPTIDNRLMASLHYLSGMRTFQHQKPLALFSMSHWRGRVGKVDLEELLAEPLRAGLCLKAVKTSQLKRIFITGGGGGSRIKSS